MRAADAPDGFLLCGSAAASPMALDTGLLLDPLSVCLYGFGDLGVRGASAKMADAAATEKTAEENKKMSSE